MVIIGNYELVRESPAIFNKRLPRIVANAMQMQELVK